MSRVDISQVKLSAIRHLYVWTLTGSTSD